jgi:hypothetical protein
MVQNRFGFERQDLVVKLHKLATDLEEVTQPEVPQHELTNIKDWALAHRVVPGLIGRTCGHSTRGAGSGTYSSELFYFKEDMGFARSFSRWHRLGNRVDPSYWEHRYPRQQ